MPIMLFNPPCPHADPVNGGAAETPGLNPCGRCVCVARYYEVLAGAAAGSGYPGAFFGEHVLTRNLAAYRTDLSERCHWDYIPPFPPGGLLVGGNSYPYGWSLYYMPGIGFNTGWILRAAGQSYVGGIPPQDVAFYTLQAPGQPQSFFNCLSPTTFWMDSNYGSAQALAVLPQSVVVQPFWP